MLIYELLAFEVQHLRAILLFHINVITFYIPDLLHDDQLVSTRYRCRMVNYKKYNYYIRIHTPDTLVENVDRAKRIYAKLRVIKFYYFLRIIWFFVMLNDIFFCLIVF